MNRRSWLILALSLLLWFVLKNWMYRSITARTELPANPQAAYHAEEGWAVLPVEVPPGAWLEPWGIDLFIIPPPSGAKAGRGLVDAFHAGTFEELVRASHKIERAFAAAGPSYSVIYRHPSAVMQTKAEDWDVARGDIAMAFERYLYEKNNWRGVMLITSPETEALLSPVLDRIKNDPRLLERFSGLVVLQDSKTPPELNVECSPVMQGNCILVAQINRHSSKLGWLLPGLPRRSIRFDFTSPDELATSLAARNTKLSIWLDKNAPKPAEPLGGLEDMEVIEIAPIRRPGETDEKIADELAESRAD